MCDYSLLNVRSRPAKVGDRLVTRDFGTGTRGFAAADDAGLAVCVMPGTELAFARDVACLSIGLPCHLRGLTVEGRPEVGRLGKRPIFYETLRKLELFFAVRFQMGFHRLFSVSSAENYVAPSYVSMVCCLLVTSGLVMLGRFPVVASGMRQMF